MIPFYCYFYLREDGSPYYVGKGCKNRAFYNGERSVFRPKDNDRIILQEYETESEAFEAEVFFISFFGRIDLDTGILRNRSNGGDGVRGVLGAKERGRTVGLSNRGRILSAEEKQRKREISLLLNTGRTLVRGAHKGHKHTTESRMKMSQKLKGKIPWNKGRKREVA